MRRSKRQEKFEGHFDGFSANQLRGWIANNRDPQHPVAVDIFVNGLLLQTVAADLYREDLAQAGKARGGACAFEVAFSPSAVMERIAKSNLKVEIFVSGQQELKLGEQIFPGGSPISFDVSKSRRFLHRMHQALGRRKQPIVPEEIPPIPTTSSETGLKSSVTACDSTGIAKSLVEFPEVKGETDRSDIRVFQFHSGSAVGDAVTNSLFYIQSLLAEFGVVSEIFVEHRDARLANRLRMIHEFVPKEDDVLIIHHSMGHDVMPALRAMKCRKILLYHNITPPSFFLENSPFRHYSLQGLKQLDEFRGMVDGAIADSAYNASELIRRGYKDVEVIPLLKDFQPLRHARFNPVFHYFDEPRYQILFVGRICANKGQLNLVRFMDQYADCFDYPVHLTLIGHFDHSEGYATELRASVDASVFKDRIRLVGHVSDEDLYGYYRAADVYLSLSEHEGFGVPLLEAMTFDVPVVALAGTAVGETLGSAGIKLASSNADEIAEALDRLFRDRRYRRKIIREQRERLKSFARSIVANQLLKFITPHLPRDAVSKMCRKPHTSRNNKNAVSRQFVIEGPCETSYSLAIVNRNLGLALDRLSGVQAAFVPAEGVAGYVLDQEGVRLHPEIKPLLGMPVASSESTLISIRNMYPLRPAGMVGDFRLAYFFWEESDVPSQLVQLINRYLDGIIVASEFGRRIYRNSGIRVPIAVCGSGLVRRSFVRKRVAASSRTEEPFTFLHVSSGMPRKGIEELLSAYVAAFSRKENVELIIKSYRHANNIVEKLYNEIVTVNGHAPVVKILFDDLTDEQMLNLYAAADAVVLPTRGEGYNLPAAEALSLGIPVVTTRYSAHLDFCNDSNAIMLDYEFELSGSHLNVGESMWVRPNISELAGKMRALFYGQAKTEVEKKIEEGLRAASSLSWENTAAAVNRFVDVLESEGRKMAKLKLAWITTWNTRCGIASYSEYLVSQLPKEMFSIDIFSNHLKDESRVDSSNVIRCWSDRNGLLDQMVEKILAGSYDVAVFQYNYGFHTIEQLGAAVKRLEDAGVDTYVFFHKTAEAKIDGETESIEFASQALARATRLVVHTVDDVNRLKGYGLVDNVVKIPQGALSALRMKSSTVRQFLRLDNFAPIIGSFGFMLPKKGLPELIFAFSTLLRQHFPGALLLMLNSQFPDPLSELERAKCDELIENLGLQNNVKLINDYLEIDEAMLLLSAADCVVFPYQDSKESSSAAVRQGISSLRPVLTTPLSIFDDVAECVEFLPGMSPRDIANGIRRLLEDSETQQRILDNQAKWLSEHNWSRVGRRLADMIVALYEDRHHVKVTGESALAERSPQATPTPPEMVQQLLVELRTEEFVRIAFHRVMGRDADREELRRFGSLLQSGQRTKAEVVGEIIASGKSDGMTAAHGSHLNGWTVAFADLSADDDVSFIRNVYYKLLIRAPTQTELMSMINEIGSGSATRRDIVDRVLALDEFVQNDLPICVV